MNCHSECNQIGSDMGAVLLQCAIGCGHDGALLLFFDHKSRLW